MEAGRCFDDFAVCCGTFFFRSHFHQEHQSSSVSQTHTQVLLTKAFISKSSFLLLHSVEYFCYVNILRRYLEATRSTYEDACREYSRLLCILEILRSLRELFESCSINFDASERMMDEFLFNNKDDDTSPSHLIIT